jgi:uncharacterized protein
LPQAARTHEFWAPTVLFGVLTLLEAELPAAWYPAAYILKALIVTVSLWIFRGPLADIRFNSAIALQSAAVGLVVFAVWVGVEETFRYPHLGVRVAFDPTPLRESGWWTPFLVTRLFGLIIMVPVMEEIFWRSFLLRYLTKPDFQRLPIGTFSASSLGIMVVASALAHPEWLVAAIASLVYAFWLRRTTSLFGAIVAHATTNAALGAYVLSTGAWQYW